MGKQMERNYRITHNQKSVKKELFYVQNLIIFSFYTVWSPIFTDKLIVYPWLITTSLYKHTHKRNTND